MMEQENRKTVEEIIQKKKTKNKIVMLTAYDYPLARAIDQCAVDIILVGDSLANVVLGLESTTEVGMAEMIHHSKAVSRAVTNAMVIGDMPFESYQKDVSQAVENAKRFIDDGGCNAVKLEWFDRCIEVAESIVKAGIPVMGHVGLTPQTAEQLGGMKVQGKDARSARAIIEHSKSLERIGCFSVVLECIPDKIAEIVTDQVNIPTIGIGAGNQCDGQVLVTHDLLGLFDRYQPKFVKKYVDLNEIIKEGICSFIREVEVGQFPDQQHSFSINEEELKKLKTLQ